MNEIFPGAESMKNNTLVTVAALLVATASPVQAQTAPAGHGWLDDTLLVDFVYVFSGTDTEVSVGVKDAPALGRTINLERDFDLDDAKSTPAFGLRWRFGEKWSLAAQYFGQDRSSTTMLERDIEWEDQVFQAGLQVKGGFEFDVYRLLFGRTFSTGPHHEFGAGVGLHWLDLGTSLSGEAFVDGESIGQVKNNVSAGAPVPDVGFWYTYAWNSRWAIRGRIDWLSASVGDYSGSLTDAGVELGWQPWDRAGFSLAYSFFRLNVDVDKSDWHGDVDATWSGPALGFYLTW